MHMEKENALRAVMPYLPSSCVSWLAGIPADDVRDILLISEKRPQLRDAQGWKKGIMPVLAEELQQTLAAMMDYSPYAFQDRLAQGYLTLQGGHRVGISGRMLMEQGRCCGIADLSALNIRIAHAVPGCAAALDWEQWYPGGSVMILGRPGCGKTTLLRDLVCNFGSDAQHTKVVLIDERDEIAAMRRGVPQLEVGERTLVISGMPKAEAMLLAIRSLAPTLIAVDEVSTRAEIEAIHAAMYAGVGVIATAHADSLESAAAKPLLGSLFAGGMVERIVVMGPETGRVRKICLREGTGYRILSEAA